MKLIQIGGKGKKKTYFNLETLTKIDLLENKNLELTWARFFDVLTPGDQGYDEIMKMIESKGETQIEG